MYFKRGTVAVRCICTATEILYTTETLKIITIKITIGLTVLNLHLWHSITSSHAIYGPQREKTSIRGFANNTGEDQPAHPRYLISAFVIHFLESIII